MFAYPPLMTSVRVPRLLYSIVHLYHYFSKSCFVSLVSYMYIKLVMCKSHTPTCYLTRVCLSPAVLQYLSVNKNFHWGPSSWC